MREPDPGFLASRGWDMTRAADVCWLDCADPGYRRTLTDARGQLWEIILCAPDAMVLEAGELDGDYTGSPTPADSSAGEWPWRAQPADAVA